jgi:hypothetical protein
VRENAREMGCARKQVAGSVDLLVLVAREGET